MNNCEVTSKTKVLTDNGLTPVQAEHVLTGAIYFDMMGGTPVSDYWNASDSFDMRDEFYLIVGTLFSLAKLDEKVDTEDWLIKYQVAFLYQLKLNAQSIKSIEILTSSACYADAFAVCRALQSRVNFLLLCGFKPDLFDHWLKHPNNQRYRDSHIRQELFKYRVYTMDHVYALASEIIHGQYWAHANIGYFEKGLFKNIPSIRNQIFVIAKFLLATSSYSFIQAMLIGSKNRFQPDNIKMMDGLYEFLIESILAPTRLEHLWTFTAEERHWKRIGKSEYKIGEAFNFHNYRDKLRSFHP